MRSMIAAVLMLCPAFPLFAQDAGPVGVVSNVKVLSDKVEDVSSMEAWKKSFITDDMNGEQKALAIWKSVVKFRTDESPPKEMLQSDKDVHDAMKIFNVYGYGMCCCASACDEALARYVGLQARGWSMYRHSISEFFYDDAWHHFDSERIYYFRKPDGAVASVDDMVKAIAEWHAQNPGYQKENEKLQAFQKAEGWKKGPALLAGSEFFNTNGWDPTGGHGWGTVMQVFDIKPGEFEYGYSQGYRVNVQLRKGERLTRNWSNKGLHVNMDDGGNAPRCMTSRESMRYQTKLGDLAPGRVGNGVHEYVVPVKDAGLALAALQYENLAPAEAGLRLKDAAASGVLVIRMPSSYVYLTGELTFKAALGAGGSVTVSFSDNNGLDHREIKTVTEPGDVTVDLKPLVFRKYDYRLKFEMKGAGTGLDALALRHDVQHSQAPLPALDAGKNTITFSADPAEGAVTIEGSTDPTMKGKQLLATDFHPVMDGVKERLLGLEGGKGSVTFPIETPGDMKRVRFGAHYRARDPRDGWDLLVSFDEGKSFRNVGRLPGPFKGNSHYVTVSDIPPGTRKALVRYEGAQRNTTCIFDFRINADYAEPAGGFAPVKITYVWTEDGAERRDVHVARSPSESYTISCEKKPVMKSIVVELAD